MGRQNSESVVATHNAALDRQSGDTQCFLSSKHGINGAVRRTLALHVVLWRARTEATLSNLCVPLVRLQYPENRRAVSNEDGIVAIVLSMSCRPHRTPPLRSCLTLRRARAPSIEHLAARREPYRSNLPSQEKKLGRRLRSVNGERTGWSLTKSGSILYTLLAGPNPRNVRGALVDLTEQRTVIDDVPNAIADFFQADVLAAEGVAEDG